MTRLHRWWMDSLFPGRARPDSLTRWQQASGMLALLVLACVLFAARLDHPLLEPEEGRYAEIPRQMLQDGRWLTPTLHGEDYWQKPPLLYWLVMASYQLFGVQDGAARLVPGLAGIGTIVITALWGWRTLGFWSGLVSGAILTLSARFLYLAGMLNMDGVLCACVLAGLAAGHLMLTEERHGRWVVLSACACGLGVLTKGPVALALVGVPLVGFLVLDGRARWALAARQAAVHGAIVVLIAGPWFGYMAWQAPDAAGAFFWLHNVTRYVAPFDHEKPAWFYLPSLFLGMMPWTLLLIPCMPYLVRRTPRARRRRPAALGVFVLALLWCVIFFSASGCKRPGYILPAFPLLALILGTFVTHGLPWRRRFAQSPGALHRLAGHLTTAACLMGMTISIATALAGLLAWSVALVPTGIFAILGIATFLLRHQPGSRCAVHCVTILFGMLLYGQRAWLPAYHERFSIRSQVAFVSEYEQEEMPIASFGKRWDSLSFYTQRRDIAVYTRAELDAFLSDLHKQPASLIFIREGLLPQVQEGLSPHLTLELYPSTSGLVRVGKVRPTTGQAW